MIKLNSLAALDPSATAVQFKNLGQPMYAVLLPSSGGGGSIVGGSAPEPVPWYFWQGAGAAQGNVEIKRKPVDGFNWSNYDAKTDASSFIAWNHAKRIPSATTPAAPHSWFIEEAGPGVFRIRHGNGEYLELVPDLLVPGTATPQVITRPLVAASAAQQWEIWVDKAFDTSPKAYDLTDAAVRAAIQARIDSIRISTLVDTRGTVASPRLARGGFYFVDFSDAPGATSGDTPAALFDRLTGLDGTGTRLLCSWMSKESGGRFQLDVRLLATTWIRMPRPRSYYAKDTSRLTTDLDTLVEVPDDLQIVYVALPPGSNSLMSSQMIGREWDRVAATGASQNTRTVILDQVAYGEAASRTPWVTIHETMHALGLPDLYVGDSRSYGWSVMGDMRTGWHITAWEKLTLGWLDLSDFLFLESGVADVSIYEQSAPAGQCKGVIVLPDATRSEAYVVEMGQEVGRSEADRARFDKWGLLFLRVELRGGAAMINPVVFRRATDTIGFGGASDAAFPNGQTCASNGVYSTTRSAPQGTAGARSIRATVAIDGRYPYADWATSLREGDRLRPAGDRQNELLLGIDGAPSINGAPTKTSDGKVWPPNPVKSHDYGFFAYVDANGVFTLTAGSSPKDISAVIGTVAPPTPLPSGAYYLKLERLDYQTLALGVYPGTAPGASRAPRAYVALSAVAALGKGWTQKTANFRATLQDDGNLVVYGATGNFLWGLFNNKGYSVDSARFTDDGQIVFERGGAEAVRYGSPSTTKGPYFLALEESGGTWSLNVCAGTGTADPARKSLYPLPV